MRLLMAGVLAAGIIQGSSGDLVELDVVVLDRANRPVFDLQRQDFHVAEDGREMDIKTFAAGGAPDDTGRHIVLLLDDSSVPRNGTAIVQGMAQAILSRRTPRDEVAVVRLNNDRDEPFGDMETAMSRIAGYHSGAVPFQSRGTADRVLTVIAAISRQLEGGEPRRKLVVCIGGPRVCNVLEPQPRGQSEVWRPWVTALSAAARANVAIYAAMPIAPGTSLMLAGGLVEATGGDGFMNTSNFDRFVDDVWAQGNAYYLLGYWPSESKRDLHSIEVKVGRKDLKVHARRFRG